MKSKGKCIALAALATALLVSVGVFALLWRRAHNGDVQYRLAEVALAREDWVGARVVLNRILTDDPASERAMKMMVTVAQKNDDPPLAAHWLGRLMNLNEFDASYSVDYRRALLRLRDFARFGAAIDALPPSVVTADDRAWRVYCDYFTLPFSDARKSLKRWRSDRSEGELSEIARLTEAVFAMEGRTGADLIATLESFAKSADEAVRTEALLALARLNLRAGRLKETETLLRSVVAIDSYVGTPELVSVLLIAGRVEEAVAENGAYLKRFPTVARAVEQSELLAALGRLGEIDGIRAIFRGNDYRSISFRNYLDALVAYGRDDMPTTYELLQSTFRTVSTPWSRMMAIAAEIAMQKPEMLENLETHWNALKPMAPFLRCHERAYSMLKSVLDRQVRAGVPVERFASLAAAMQHPSPEATDLDLERVQLLAGLRSRTVPMETMSLAAFRHPTDPGILQLAAEAALMYNLPEDAIGYAKRLEATGTNVASAVSLAMRAHFARASGAMTNSTDRAAASAAMDRYFATVSSPSAEDLESCWRYVNATLDTSDIARLGAASAEHAPFCAALTLFAEGRRDAALDALEKIKSGNDRLMAWCAAKLAEGDRNEAAIARYEALPASFSENPGQQINLSELYSAVGRAEQALSLAERAWRKFPDHPHMQTCYARRLAERGEWAKIREIVRIPKDTSGLDARLLKVWGQAMEKGIEEAWRTERYFEVRDCCRKLLAYSPGNAVAEDYMAKFEAWQQKQRRFVPVRKREEAADGDKKKEVE